MQAEILKTVLHVEKVFVDGGKAAEQPLLMIGAAAVVKNPWFGRGYVEDLKPEIRAQSPGIGKLLTEMILDVAGSGDAVEGVGKCSIVGTGGEMEHGAAMIHTLQFGNQYREAVASKSYLGFNNTRGPANAPILIPLMDKNDTGRRSHYVTIQFSIPDAPAEDEVVIALGGCVGGRIHHRIGDRYQDLAELGRDVENPAAV